MQCDKDDADPTSQCAPCREKGLECSPRRLPDNRLQNLCANIQKNHLKDILKWMTGLDSKELELLRGQLPDPEAGKLFDAWDRDFLMQPNSIGEQSDAWTMYCKFFYPWLISFPRPVNLHAPIVPDLQQGYFVPDYTSQNLPLSRMRNLADRLQPSTPPQFQSPESLTSFVYPLPGQESKYHRQFSINPGYHPFTTNSPTTITDNRTLLPRDETYPQTWTEGEAATIYKTMLSQKFPSLPPDRLDSLLTQFHEKIDFENQSTAAQLSEFQNTDAASVVENLYTSVLDDNYTDVDAGI